ncbi:MAG TPA: hypothetical protein PKG56_03550 [Chitinophagaceae bacterium]|nr:hypothetical protein [Chitinophagaceae bacterium]
MKKLGLTFLFFSIFLLAYGQDKLDRNTIIGKWVAFGMLYNEVYYNLDTDSFYISPEKYDLLLSQNEDTIGAKKYLRNLMLSILPFNFNFKKNGNCTFENKNIFERTTYAFDELKKIITIFNATTGKFINLEAYMKDNDLYINMNKDDSNSIKGSIIFKKIK